MSRLFVHPFSREDNTKQKLCVPFINQFGWGSLFYKTFTTIYLNFSNVNMGGWSYVHDLYGGLSLDAFLGAALKGERQGTPGLLAHNAVKIHFKTLNATALAFTQPYIKLEKGSEYQLDIRNITRYRMQLRFKYNSTYIYYRKITPFQLIIIKISYSLSYKIFIVLWQRVYNVRQRK